MTWKRSTSFLAVGTLLSTIAAGAANGHEAHRQGGAATLEATEREPAPGRVAPATEEPSSKTDSHSTHPPHTPTDVPPAPLSIFSWLGRLHPMAIHFPIALFLAALVAELLFAATREELFRHALRFSLWGGAMSAIIAAPLGWMFAASGATEEGWLLETHRWAGTAAFFLGAAVLWIGERTERTDGNRLLLRVSLAFQALLIGSVGFLGASLLYGFDHLWKGI
jgi:uncharacterized membrane protein